MKVIFLDIDGVMVNRASYRLPRIDGHARAHPDCVSALNHLIEQTVAHMVISSVWRIGGVSFMRDMLNAWGVKGKVLGCTPDLCHQKDSHLIVEGKERGDEIQAWLDEREKFRGDVESFVILDDDSDMKHLQPRLV